MRATSGWRTTSAAPKWQKAMPCTPSSTRSGLDEAARVLEGVQGIAFCHFGAADVVRHPLVARIVEAYGRATPAPT